MTGVRLLSVAPDDSTVHRYLAVDDTVYPIASYTHLLAPNNIVIEYKGPLVAALYQDKPLSKRQQALVRTTLQKMPHTLHDLYKRTLDTTNYTVLFKAVDTAPARKRARR